MSFNSDEKPQKIKKYVSVRGQKIEITWLSIDPPLLLISSEVSEIFGRPPIEMLQFFASQFVGCKCKLTYDKSAANVVNSNNQTEIYQVECR